MRLQGKVAIITGAANGMGAEEAMLFAREGARVAVSDLKLETAQRVADSVVAAGGDAVALAGDVSDRNQCESLVADTVGKLGGIDVLINSAGVTPRYAPKEWDFEQTWDWVVSINLKGSMMMSRFAVAEMRKHGSGSIVNLASIIGLVGYAQGISDGFNPYPHAKGGVVQMTRDMSIALAKEGIRVNSLCPGFTYTPLVTTLVEGADMHERLKSLHPMGRLGEANEIANAALFLASDEASFITGVNLPVDGGYTAQ